MHIEVYILYSVSSSGSHGIAVWEKEGAVEQERDEQIKPWMRKLETGCLANLARNGIRMVNMSTSMIPMASARNSTLFPIAIKKAATTFG